MKTKQQPGTPPSGGTAPGYTVRRAAAKPSLRGRWAEPAWRGVPALRITHWHPRGSRHRPRTEAKLVYDDDGLFVLFRVRDRYVVCRHAAYQSPVCLDSCVEFFVEPVPGRGYFNFEVNAGGALLLSHVVDPVRVNGAFRCWRPVPRAWGRRVRIRTSLPRRVDPEQPAATAWWVEYFVPFALFEAHAGPLGPVPGAGWRANFYKCADRSSHPHWGSWAPIGEALNFHQPARFAPLRFA